MDDFMRIKKMDLKEATDTPLASEFIKKKRAAMSLIADQKEQNFIKNHANAIRNIYNAFEANVFDVYHTDNEEVASFFERRGFEVRYNSVHSQLKRNTWTISVPDNDCKPSETHYHFESIVDLLESMRDNVRRAP